MYLLWERDYTWRLGNITSFRLLAVRTLYSLAIRGRARLFRRFPFRALGEHQY